MQGNKEDELYRDIDGGGPRESIWVLRLPDSEAEVFGDL